MTLLAAVFRDVRRVVVRHRRIVDVDDSHGHDRAVGAAVAIGDRVVDRGLAVEIGRRRIATVAAARSVTVPVAVDAAETVSVSPSRSVSLAVTLMTLLLLSSCTVAVSLFATGGVVLVAHRYRNDRTVGAAVAVRDRVVDRRLADEIRGGV